MSVKKKLIAFVFTMLLVLGSISPHVFSSEISSEIENSAEMVIIDSVTGTVIQDISTINVIINSFEMDWDTKNRYQLRPLDQLDGEVVNKISNDAIIVLENSVTGDIYQNITNENMILNNFIYVDGKQFRVDGKQFKIGRKADVMRKRNEAKTNTGNKDKSNEHRSQSDRNDVSINNEKQNKDRVPFEPDIMTAIRLRI